MLTRQAFWYLRHGETNWNVEGRSQGNVEVPLNPRGMAQAREAGAALLGRGIRSVVSSPLARAPATAQNGAGARGLAVDGEKRQRPSPKEQDDEEEDDDDFIDDDNAQDWRSMLRSMTGYNPSR